MNELAALISSNAIPIATGNRLAVTIWNTTGGDDEIVIIVRTLDENGQLTYTAERFIIPDDGVSHQKTIRLTKGQLVGVTLTPEVTPFDYGTMYAQIAVISGDVDSNLQTLVLCSGYISGAAPLTYPPTQQSDPINPPGALLQTTFADPAAGAELNVAQASDRYDRAQSFKVEFIASAAVANRTILLGFRVNSVEVGSVVDTTVITAGQTRTIWAWRGPNIPANTTTNHYVQAPDAWQGRAIGITTTTTNIDIADQYAGASIFSNRNTTPA